MSKALEYQGKNVDQALQEASDELKIPVAKIKHEVIAYGSSGIFGLVGVKKAKIRVFVEEKQAFKKIPEPVLDSPATDKADSLSIDSKESDDQSSTKYDEGLVNSGIDALQKIVDSISSGATAGVDKKRDRLLYTVTGGESGVLIGKRGQTLEAMQYLVEKIINRQNDDRIRVQVDIEGYLKNRKDNLKQLLIKKLPATQRFLSLTPGGNFIIIDRS